MTTDERLEDEGPSTLRKVAVPTAVTAAGAAAGLVLTQKPKLRRIMSELRELGLGDIADDLRDRVEAAIARRGDGGDGRDDDEAARDGAASPTRDQAERDERRADRKRRREERRKTAT